MRRVAEEVGDHTAFRRGAGRETPVVADDVEGRRVDPAARKLRDHRGDLLQKSRLPRVVGVQQGDVVARRFGDGAVAGRAFAGVGLRDEFHERRADAAHDFCAAVRRTVVHDDDLCRGQRLG